MVFKIFGLVRWKGKKIANGIDGRFETKDEKVINILRNKGFEEIKEEIPQKVTFKTIEGNLTSEVIETMTKPTKVNFKAGKKNVPKISKKVS